MKHIQYLFLFMTAVQWVSAQNVMISNQSNPNEPSIMVDPKHTNVLIAASNMNNYYLSSDTGHTWTSHTLSSTFGVGGDPTIVVDTASNFYFFHLSNPSGGSWLDRIVCQKTTNNGQSWSNGTYTGLNGAKDQDKQWCCIDRKNNTLYVTWTQFDTYGSSSQNDSSVILFSRSTDGGATWSTGKRINKIAGDCVDEDKTVEGAVPAVGPNGEVYVAWAGPSGIVFNRSTDKGNTWLSKEILVNTMPGGWDYSIPGIGRCNGLPVTVCDLSNGPNRGTIYINWSDQRNGSSNTDIWLSKSTDGGNTWSTALKVNDDATNRHQFFTWLAIDQVTGYLYTVFYDRRNYTDNSTDVYVAASINGGNSFVNRKISQTPFIPTTGVFFGDYTNITAHNGVIRPIWTRLNNSQLSVWTDMTTLNDILLDVDEPFSSNAIPDFENYPNPSANFTYVSFKLLQESKVNLSIYDLAGKEIKRIIASETRNYGKYVERINLDELKIHSGIYLLKLEINSLAKTSRLIVVK